MPGDLVSSYAHCETVLREEDRDAWLASLFAPSEARPGLHALGAFFTEIRRVRDRVRQPLAGELRLQWWRDVLEGEARGDALANPVAAALLDTIARASLSSGTLIDAIEAHRTALYGEAPATVADMEAQFDRTFGASIRSEMRLLSGAIDAGEEVSRAAAALGIADLLRHLGHYVNRGFAVVPDEMLGRYGIGQSEFAARGQDPENPAIRSVLSDLRAVARRHLATLRAERARIPEAAGPAFLTVSLVEPTLRLSEKPGADPFAGELALPQWRRQWVLWRAARRGTVG